MGDVRSITDAQGNELVQYEYDEWGALASVYTPNNSETENAVANINPLRYRGYYLDSETGYYYLQSRYYDPSICRFINADDYNYVDKDIVNGTNIFAYCSNNTVNYCDLSGHYRTDLAKSYPAKWWNGRNEKYKSNKSDCANFLSQCLFEGKLSSMTNDWYNKKKNGRKQISKAWGKASTLYSWLYSNHYVRKTYIATKKADVDKAGEFIYKYRNKKHCVAAIFFDWENDGKVDHAALSGQIRGKEGTSYYDIYYYAHTRDRAGIRKLYNDGKYASIKDAFKQHSKMKVYILLLV